jgi:plasmid maintenance system antidote protein VapI
MPRPAIHPGEILADELNELKITPTGKRAITGDTALRLGHWFQTSAQFWLNLQSAYDLRVATDGSASRWRRSRRLQGGGRADNTIMEMRALDPAPPASSPSASAIAATDKSETATARNTAT